MKRFVIAMVGLLYLAGSQNERFNLYDQGYEAAWEDEELPYISWLSQECKDGYEQGLEDSLMYDEGYSDGLDKEKPRYPNDEFYMDGYRDGKKDS